MEEAAEPSSASRAAAVLGAALSGAGVGLLALGFLGRAWWVFDLLSNFRLQLGVVLLLIAAATWRVTRQAAQVALFAGVVALTGIIPLYVGSRPLPADAVIEVVSFNVGVSNPHRAEVASFLAGEQPDLVFLFESSFEWEDAMRDAGLPLTLVSIVPRGRVAGVTVLAAAGINPAAVDVDVGGEAAAVTVSVGGIPVDVLGVHPPSPTSSARAGQRDRMLAAAGAWAASRSNPVIVVGDFNATPWSQAYRALRWTGGLVDTLTGSGLQASWPDGWGPLAIPIDHVLHSPDLGSSGRRTGPSFASAHRPVLVSIGPAP